MKSKDYDPNFMDEMEPLEVIQSEFPGEEEEENLDPFKHLD